MILFLEQRTWNRNIRQILLFFRWVRCSRPAVHDFVPLNRTQVQFFCSTEQKFPNRKLCSLYFCPDSEQRTEFFKDKNRANRTCPRARLLGNPYKGVGTRTMYFQRASMYACKMMQYLQYRVAYVLIVCTVAW